MSVTFALPELMIYPIIKSTLKMPEHAVIAHLWHNLKLTALVLPVKKIGPAGREIPMSG
jgi:hypothetical protein